jgi:hypothetical protein
VGPAGATAQASRSEVAATLSIVGDIRGADSPGQPPPADDQSSQGQPPPADDLAASAPRQLPDRPDSRDKRNLLRLFAVLLVIWFGLSMAALTTSSISSFASEGSTDGGVLFGEPRAIRSDEYARSTPLQLGVEAVGSTRFVTPLTNSTFLISNVPSGSPLENLIYPEKAILQLGPWLPDGQLFAASFWAVPLMVVALVPLVVVLWGGRFWPGLLAAAAVVLSPCVAWWSMLPLVAIVPGLAVSACWLLGARISGSRRWLWWPILAVVGALACARIPLSYAPWSIPLAAALLSVTAVTLICDKGRRRVGIWLMLATGVLAAVITLVVLWQNAAAFEAIQQSLYPGQRRSSGEDLGFAFVFSAPFQGWMQEPPNPTGSNPSEFSSSWTFLAIALLGLAVATWRRSDRGERVQSVVFLAITAIGLSWILIDWPAALGARIPLLNLVPPLRMQAILGLVITLGVATLLSRYPIRWQVAAAIAVASAVMLTVVGVIASEKLLRSLPTLVVLLVALIVGAALWLLTNANTKVATAGGAIAVVAMAATVAFVNPIQQGLGPLRSSEAASTVSRLAGEKQPDDGLWAAHGLMVNPLLAANGIPMISGDQWSGPSPAWRVLDPAGKYEQAWNRAAAWIVFDWDTSLPAPVITAPAADSIEIHASPCDPALSQLNVRHLLAGRQLQADCLQEEGRTTWASEDLWIYRRR